MSGSVNAVYRESGTNLHAMFDADSTLHIFTSKMINFLRIFALSYLHLTLRQLYTRN